VLPKNGAVSHESWRCESAVPTHEKKATHSRECLSLEVEYSIPARSVVEILQSVVDERGAPEFIRSDNGPEFIARAVKAWIAEKGMKTLYIEPGAP
jgi:putative transposase